MDWKHIVPKAGDWAAFLLGIILGLGNAGHRRSRCCGWNLLNIYIYSSSIHFQMALYCPASLHQSYSLLNIKLDRMFTSHVNTETSTGGERPPAMIAGHRVSSHASSSTVTTSARFCETGQNGINILTLS